MRVHRSRPFGSIEPRSGNQLYIKHHEGDEDFEPVEAYFFDPTEYLEEDESRFQSCACMTRYDRHYQTQLNVPLAEGASAAAE